MSELEKRPIVYIYLAVALLVIVVIAFFIIASNGYGDNGDNYRMLRAWQEMLIEGTYGPSRTKFQGNIVSEFSLGFLASLAGPVGTNVFSFTLSATALGLAWKIFHQIRQDSVQVTWVLLIVLLNPYWMQASSTAMDYVHPFPAVFLGIFLLMKDRPALAAIALAVAAGTRLSFFPVGLFALVSAWKFEADPTRRKSTLDGIPVFLAISGLFYIPVFINSHLTLDFLGAAIPDRQGFFGLVARWVYKLINLYGVVGSAVLLGGLAYAYRSFRKAGIVLTAPEKKLVGFALATIGYHLILFLGLPIRAHYLLPVLLACAALLVVLRTDIRILVVLALTQLLFWFSSVDLLEIKHLYDDPCKKTIAVDASISPHLAPGILLPALSGQTNEARCLPQLLLRRPANIFDPLPPSPFGREAGPE